MTTSKKISDDPWFDKALAENVLVYSNLPKNLQTAHIAICIAQGLLCPMPKYTPQMQEMIKCAPSVIHSCRLGD